MKKIILISVVIHVILIVVLAPLIKTRMEFDEQKEVQRTEEVKKREADRKEQDRLRREKQKLDEKTAKMLKREAELRKKEEIKQQVTELRKKRDEMMERRDEELERFREREKKDVLAREQTKIAKIASRMQRNIDEAARMAEWKDICVGSYRDAKFGINGMLDDVKISRRIWEDGEIANEPTSPVTADHYWNFENGVIDGISGLEGNLEKGGAVGEREDGVGSAFLGNSQNGYARLGPIELGDTFSVGLWVDLAELEHGQVLFTNRFESSYHQGVTILVEGTGDAAFITFESSGSKVKRAKVSSVPGSFKFGRWSHIVVTADMESSRAEIFIDGVKMELSSDEVAKDAFTDKADLSGLDELSDKVAEMLKQEIPSVENAEQLATELDKVSDLVAEQMKETEDLQAVRNELSAANKNIEAAKEILESLGKKTNMAEMNNTDAAKAEEMQAPVPAEENTANASQMYNEAEGLEKQIAVAKADIDAASEAVSQNTSYAEAREKAMETTPGRPDLTSALSGKAPGTVGELNEFRENLNRAENEMQDMNARADSALGRSAQQSLSASSFATGAAMSSAASQTQGNGQVVDMTAFGQAGGEGDSQEMRKDETGEGKEMAFSNMPKSLNIDEGKIIRAAMPGRRFTESSMRKGWLYLDTWYVIGPWENRSIVDYTVKHPPEFGIDFDAKYYDGKFSDRPGHPYESLKWEFYQSDQVRCQPPKVYASSTYYAYTDVWFEEARDMLIAVASDDASSVWLNGQIVWQDVGQSSWMLGEGYRKVHFKQGFNDVLVRIENGPAHCVWSVVLCPPEMLNK